MKIVVTMNFAGFAKKSDQILPLYFPCFFLSSMENLFAEMNTTSMPEKNPITSNAIIMGIKVIQLIIHKFIK
jgi:hypothetical protein